MTFDIARNYQPDQRAYAGPYHAALERRAKEARRNLLYPVEARAAEREAALRAAQARLEEAEKEAAALKKKAAALKLENEALKLAIGKPDDLALAALSQMPVSCARRIIAEVALRYGVLSADILGERRTLKIVRARQEAMALIAEATGWSLPRLGRLFHRDHTTVLHGIRRHRERLAAQGDKL